MAQFPTINATTPTGGTAKISLYDPKGGEANVGGGAKNLSQAQMNAYRQAKTAMAKGNEAKAREILRAAGFDC
jgi:hypothetical protein